MAITTTLKRIIKSAWVNFFRNAGLSFVSVFAVFVVVFLASSIFLVRDVTNIIIEGVEDKISIGIYFKDNVAEDDIVAVQEEILTMEGVEKVEYTSKNQALADFIERHKENLTLMASLAEVDNPFPASLNVKAETSDDYKRIALLLSESPSVTMFDKIDYDSRRSVIESIFAISSNISKSLVATSIVLAIISILIVFNTIRLAIYGMKDELEIMKLVGVSHRFIRGSFVFQGIIVGLVATIMGLILITASAFIFRERMGSLIAGFDFIHYLTANFGIIFLMQFLTGFILGVASSFTAAKSYLK